jgi:Flp pilus assembly protein TadD
MLSQALNLIQRGDFAGALQILQQVLSADPENPDALHMAGVSLLYSGNAGQSAELLIRAVRLRPDRVDYQFNLGSALAAAGRRDEAIAAFLHAATLPFNEAAPLAQLARELHNLGQYAAALGCSTRAVTANPNDAESLTIYGQNLMATGQNEAALAALRRAVAMRPNDADARWDVGMLLLKAGQLREGYREFEWRLRSPGGLLLRGFPSPQWTGSNLVGKTLLVHAEGGFGDTIHYVRYVPPMKDRALRLVLECQGDLIPLLQSLDGVDEIIARGQPLPAFDFHVPLPSLPAIFGTDLNSVPNAVPYLTVPDDRLKKWAERVGSDGKLKIGLCWSGNRGDPTDKRSIELQKLAPIASIPGVRFVSLQMGEDAKQPRPSGMELADYTSEIRDFADTAALISQLDLVVSIDTSVAHLAGALGKPVWLLLPNVAAYQWIVGRTDSPWYPTMRVFRQPVQDDWETAISQLSEALGSITQ